MGCGDVFSHKAIFRQMERSFLSCLLLSNIALVAFPCGGRKQKVWYLLYPTINATMEIAEVWTVYPVSNRSSDLVYIMVVALSSKPSLCFANTNCLRSYIAKSCLIVAMN